MTTLNVRPTGAVPDIRAVVANLPTGDAEALLLSMVDHDLQDARRVRDYVRICRAADDLEFIFVNTQNEAIGKRARKLFDEAFDPTPELDHA